MPCRKQTVWLEPDRVVTKVDELMALCDELEERQGKLREVRHQVCTASHAALTTATTPKQFAHHWTRIRNHCFSVRHRGST